jgi:hypothetical protein
MLDTPGNRIIGEEAEEVAVAVHRLILLLRAVLKFVWCDI